jgi:hypothetical protein
MDATSYEISAGLVSWRAASLFQNSYLRESKACRPSADYSDVVYSSVHFMLKRGCWKVDSCLQCCLIGLVGDLICPDIMLLIYFENNTI